MSTGKRRHEEIPDLLSLKKLKVAELKDWCNSAGVSKKGNKNELIAALESARSTSSAPAVRSPLHGTGLMHVQTSPSANRSAVPTPLQQPKKPSGASMFSKYAADSGKIDMEGFMKFGLELAMGDENMSATPEHTALLLYLSWKMKSPAFAEFTREGFIQGCEAMQCFCEKDIMAKRKVLLSEVSGVDKFDSTKRGASEDRFQTFHSFVYDVLRPSGKKYVEKDMAILALQVHIVMQLRDSINATCRCLFFRCRLCQITYLMKGKAREKMESINSDQWKGFLQFSREVDAAFSGYSDEDPWPSLLDDFVSWAKTQEEWIVKHATKQA